MAISWSSWHYSGNNGMRIGIDYSWGGLSGGNKRTITWKIYTNNQYRYNDNQSIDLDDDFSGSQTINYSNTQGAGTTSLRGTRTYTYTYKSNEYGSSPGTVTLRADVTKSYNGSKPGKRRTVSIPARPYTPPAPPSDVAVARITDNLVHLSWTNNTSGAAPYTTLEIQRREYLGTDWSPWSLITTVAGSVNNWNDSTTVDNAAYEYRIRAVNSAGASNYEDAVSSTVYMTPGPVSDVTAQVIAGTIKLDWTNTTYTHSNNSVKIERSNNGGAYTTVATLNPVVTTWTDSTPGTGTKQYRISIIRTVPTSLSSAPVLSDVVTTVAPPLAPTELFPTGKVDFSEDQTFKWKHNHAGDGIPQSAYELQVSSDGGSTWTAYAPGLTVSTVSERLVPGGTLSNGVDYLWRVRTRGDVATGVGAWSTPVSVRGEYAPVISIVSPPSVVQSFPAVIDWTYFQADGHPQTYWAAGVYEGPVFDPERLIATYFGTTETEVDIGEELLDGGEYTVRVIVISTDSIQAFADKTFVVDLLPPQPGVIDGQYDPCTGTVGLEISLGDESGYDSVDHFDLQRQMDDGDWFTVASGLPPGAPYPVQYSQGFPSPATDPDEPTYGWVTDTDDDTKDPSGTPSLDTVTYLDGNASLKVPWAVPLTPGKPQWVGFRFTDLIPGQEYTLVSSVRWTSGSGPIRPEMLGAPGSFGPTIVGAADTWHTNAFTFVPDGSEVSVGYSNLNPDDGQFLNVDRAVLYVGAVTGYDQTLSDPLLITDTVPNVAAPNKYRVITYAPSGTATIGSEITVAPVDENGQPCGWVFLSYGRGFRNIVRLGGDIQFSVTSQRQRSTAHYLGRQRPLLGVGQATDLVVQASGVLMWPEEDCPGEPCDYDSSAAEWEAASLDAGIVCYRDYTGRRVFGALSEVVVSKGPRSNTAPISFTVTETQYTERPGLLMGGT